MVLMGMLHHRADPINVKKAYAYATVARAEGVDFFYFSPGKVDIHKKIIMGKEYERGKWVEKEFPFPDVIFNASGPTTPKAERIINDLYDQIPITSYSIGNKLSVYKRIQKGREFEEYLIPSEEVTDFKTIEEMLDSFDKIIVKPLSGHQGGGILLIEKEGSDTYKINEKGEIKRVSENEFIHLLQEKMDEENYLVQPFITCKIKSGNVFDFRLHVQKNGEGKWVITSIYPRIGRLGTITSNMGSGGYTAYLQYFLQSEFNEKWFDVYQKLKWFALNFPIHFDSLYRDESFDELGIDVGLDQNQKLWLFEVNWRPGAPMIFNLELDTAQNTVLYAKYLALNFKKSQSDK